MTLCFFLNLHNNIYILEINSEQIIKWMGFIYLSAWK